MARIRAAVKARVAKVLEEPAAAANAHATLELSSASRFPHATVIVATLSVDLSPLGPVSSILRPLLLRYFQSKFDEERQAELEIARKLTP